MARGQTDDVTTTPCPKCGHTDEDHRRESWYDEEGIEGMTCQVCDDAGRQCQWWTWDWAEVVANMARCDFDDDPSRGWPPRPAQSDGPGSDRDAGETIEP